MTALLYFAWVRERAGLAGEEIDIPGDIDSVGALIGWLRQRHPEAFADPERLRVAVDLKVVSFDAPIAGAREIAFFPPVTGG
ncbi:MAG: molybdopterin converting factor subunit 1 [Sphingomonadaceae bacterium]|nr:molybdopterin converting factor subunit 1 [Sphingomonadaceae bacterium]